MPTGTIQDLQLTPEARAILANELQLFSQQFLPEQQQLFANMLQRLGLMNVATPEITGLTAASDTARQATQQAGQQYGLSGLQLGNTDRALASNQPDLVAGLQALMEQLGTRQQSLVDPRFAQFLQPQAIQRQASPSTAESVASIAVPVATAAANFV